MKKEAVRRLGYIVLVMLLPLLAGCNNEDDVIGIFTGKSWKLSRLTTKGSNQQFLSNLWDTEKEYNNSMALLEQDQTFIVTFQGVQLDGELTGTAVTARGVTSSMSGTWSADGKSNSLSISFSSQGSESDPLAKAFVEGLQNVYKYEGDANSLTLYYKDGQTTKVIGLVAK